VLVSCFRQEFVKSPAAEARANVPEGRPKIARQFTGEFETCSGSSAGGTNETSARHRELSRLSGTVRPQCKLNPALKRRAIVDSPRAPWDLNFGVAGVGAKLIDQTAASETDPSARNRVKSLRRVQTHGYPLEPIQPCNLAD
jgi:hypothetical protein